MRAESFRRIRSPRIDRGATAIDDIVARGETVYGVNTGFGLLANTSIAHDDLEALQRNLVLSHACGVGPLLSDDVVRLVLVLKAASLARGASGVRRETVFALQTTGGSRSLSLHSRRKGRSVPPAIWRRSRIWRRC